MVNVTEEEILSSERDCILDQPALAKASLDEIWAVVLRTTTKKMEKEHVRHWTVCIQVSRDRKGLCLLEFKKFKD